MRTPNPTQHPADLVNLVWQRAGRPRKPRPGPGASSAVDRLTEAAEALRLELDAYVAYLGQLADACDETRRCPPPCGVELETKLKGRPGEYCSRACRQRANRMARA